MKPPDTTDSVRSLDTEKQEGQGAGQVRARQDGAPVARQPERAQRALPAGAACRSRSSTPSTASSTR